MVLLEYKAEDIDGDLFLSKVFKEYLFKNSVLVSGTLSVSTHADNAQIRLTRVPILLTGHYMSNT